MNCHCKEFATWQSNYGLLRFARNDDSQGNLKE